jgi:hypothetical protein
MSAMQGRPIDPDELFSARSDDGFGFGEYDEEYAEEELDFEDEFEDEDEWADEFEDYEYEDEYEDLTRRRRRAEWE